MNEGLCAVKQESLSEILEDINKISRSSLELSHNIFVVLEGQESSEYSPKPTDNSVRNLLYEIRENASETRRCLEKIRSNFPSPN